VAQHWRRGAALGLLLAGAFVGALASHLSYAIDDLAESADAIRRQQASLGHWARAELPDSALIGVNDTGAIAYLSGRRTFDVVGLTTKGEARYWAAGRGSRFEHFETLEPARRPTHFIVYPDWLGHPPLLGELLTERVVEATILGGTRMVAHVADYSTLGSGRAPAAPPERALADELDVADLESESAHGYELLDATQADNSLEDEWIGERRIADGARRQRFADRFELVLEPGGLLVLRVGLAQPAKLVVDVDGRRVAALELPAKGWQETTLELPRTIVAGRRHVQVQAEGSRFTSMHYWSYR
jgi:hypothetical protein